MKYHRPQTIDEAIALLSEGVPLAGGTVLAPRRRSLQAVIDLEHLGLDTIEVESGMINIGAAAKLQDLIDPELDLPKALRRACQLEAAWNLRNMATVGGTVMSADARSPLLLVLLALDSQLSVHGDENGIGLEAILDRRAQQGEPFLITQLSFEPPLRLSYEYVARTPTDRPQVSAAAAMFKNTEQPKVAIGGFGERPQLLKIDGRDSPGDLKQLAADLYAHAGDAFASAEYRSEVVSVLVDRVVKEVHS